MTLSSTHIRKQSEKYSHRLLVSGLGTTTSGGGNLQKTDPTKPPVGVWDSTVPSYHRCLPTNPPSHAHSPRVCPQLHVNVGLRRHAPIRPPRVASCARPTSPQCAERADDQCCRRSTQSRSRPAVSSVHDERQNRPELKGKRHCE